MSRDEIYLNAILTGDTSSLPTPISSVDKYLYQIAMNGTSGGGGSTITVDSELSTTSENPVQNKIITSNINAIVSQISDINNILVNLPTGDTTITSVFDSANYSNYLEDIIFLIDQWGTEEYTLTQAIEHTSSICSSEYDYRLRLSSDIGWSANVKFMYINPIELKSTSILQVDCSCSTTGSDIAVDVLSSADFSAEPIASFNIIPSFFADDKYMLLNISLVDTITTGNYYLRFSYTTENPVFLIKNIKIIT